MNLSKKCVYSLGLSLSLICSAAIAGKPELSVFGQVEQTKVEGVSEAFSSRIDTGATTSSINAVNIEVHKVEGKDYVTFDVPQANGEAITMKKEVVRWASIRQAHSEQTTQRPVIQLEVEIQDQAITAEFSLKDRNHMTYPVLIGRNILSGRAVVDVAVNSPES